MRSVTFFLILLLFINSERVVAQERNADLIIIIDEHILIGECANARFIYKNNNGVSNEIQASYKPGKLTYNGMTSGQMVTLSDTILFAFDYSEYCNQKQAVYNYKIPIKKAWLEGSYLVIHIYNLDKKKYRKEFFPITGSNYTYDFDTPNGGVYRIRKKAPKNHCN